MEFDLKLSDGRVVRWQGRDGEDAAREYVAGHPDAAVVAWRAASWRGLHIGLPRYARDAPLPR